MKRKKLPADRASRTHTSIAKPQWRATAAALAAAVLLGVASTDANAIALGRVTVQSALGEPLRAEIDIPEITPEEVSSLRTNVAAPDAFKAAGVEYNPALTNVRITLERRTDGRYFLRLVSARPINDPFVDLILETTWASGRVVRDYTMLLDPPSMRPNQAPLSAETSPGAPASRAAATAASPANRSNPARASASASPTAPRPAAEARAPAGEGKQVTVRGGETAGSIASSNKPANVSLDQMLVAMLRANPDAFAGGNVNRLRAGAVIDVPSGAQAAQVPADEARQTLVAQSRDFNEFRRRMAEGVPTTRTSPAERESSGKITAQVEEKRPAAAAPDKLTLSKGTAAGTSGIEEKIARERAAKDSATRVAELSKNLADLGKVGTPAATGGAAPTAAASAAKPGVAVPMGAPATGKAATPTPPVIGAASAVTVPAGSASAAKPIAPVAASASAPVAAQTAATTASGPSPAGTAATAAQGASAPSAAAAASAPAPLAAASAAASAPAASTPLEAASSPAAGASAPVTASAAPVAAPKAPAAPAPTSFLEDMIDNPVVPASIGAVLALLLGFGLYRAQQRKKSTQVDSSFLESRLQPDSFFGASGGQRIDTNEGATGSSMVYSPSQLDAAGDVDPVAEADVYLAYGRDLQAEEILKEAMRTQPQRVAIHSKLLEIYAKRRDARAFEMVATEAHKLTGGEGPEWGHICELGQELDGSNALYRPGGQPSDSAVATATGAAMGTFGATTVTQAYSESEAPSSTDLDLDLDLDFSAADDEPAAASSGNALPDTTQALNAQAGAEPEPVPALDMDFDLPAGMLDLPVQDHGAVQPTATDTPELNVDEDALSFDLDLPADAAAPTVAAEPVPPAPEAGMIEFDLGSLSLDLPGAEPEAPHASASLPDLDDLDDVDSTAGAPLSTAGFDDTGGDDPLATKLALAQEFNAIGDPDGARSLAQEVVAEASGDLKTAAQKFLADIS